jgi:DNA processing protein
VEPAPWRFPARNRIVAGLAQVTVVIEAREKSGALITADLAVEEGREVFVVPGEITSALSAGTNALIKLGAAVATSAADVLDAFGLAPEPPSPPDLTLPAEAVLDRLREGPQSADELVRALALDAGAAAAALTELELHGLLTETSGIFRAVVR